LPPCVLGFEGKNLILDYRQDDIAILIGSEIVRTVRAAVREKLKYTCSGGIAQNKMLAKLGSGHKKPNQQTVIRNRAVQQFLSDFKFTKIRGLGGKLGDQATSAFNTDTVKDLLPIPIEQLKQKLGGDTGTWVYQVIRGIDSSEVNSRTQIKSMLSAKSFRPSINTPEQANRWLRIFVADIYARLVEDGVLENKRRPKTINLHHRTAGQTSSRQAPIPQGKKLDEASLFDLAKNLMGQVILEGRIWPCANISLSVGGLEDGITGNMNIGAFLLKGDEAKVLNTTPRGHVTTQAGGGKRRRIESTGGIQKFFTKTDSIDEHDDEYGAQQLPGADILWAETHEADLMESGEATTSVPQENEANDNQQMHNGPLAASSSHHQKRITDFVCNRCSLSLPSVEDFQSHQDWHFAKDLQDQDRGRPAQLQNAKLSKKAIQHPPKKQGGRGKSEKGQSKLAFG
jgi:DNA polymerase eta